MIDIITEKELAVYDLEGKWNDYIGVQKEVLRVLRDDRYFEENEIVNYDSGMLVKITPKGVRETLGSGNRFKILPKVFKTYKVATLKYLPELIRTGNVIEEDVVNSHDENGYHYAYIGNMIIIDGVKYGVRIAIRKKVSTNHFWIHNIDEIKKL
ncbi:MAG: hypothetical protein IJZ96_00220 [Lachnospiraceae bacterium]|nr:hypothetical protein [Lachnospiraceae bacterium]MBQ8317299.1 hypothetical protein [Lachnospiraceae bacterium]